MNDTIAAISTPLGEGGIGIVRLSGPRAGEIATELFRPYRPSRGPFPSHHLLLGEIVDPAQGEVVDEVLLSLMRGPHSYTREDVVEINCHSGYGVLARILRLTLQQGARLARPGEFTQRAFLSGRLDLIQAEAVLEIIQARTEVSLKVAAQHLAGSLGQAIGGVRERVLDLLAQVEAGLDFPEEIPEISPKKLLPELTKINQTVQSLAESYVQGRLLREGLSVVIAGRPNVGKSSLLNQLLQEERAIVTEIPGTTRDVIEESLSIQGLPVRLSDTAGLRQAGDRVEELGVERTRKLLTQADLVLYLLDISQPAHPEDEIQLTAMANTPTLLVLNKCDLPPILAEMELGFAPPSPPLKISALTGEGIPELKEAILRNALNQSRPPCDQIVTQARHQQHLAQALVYLQQAEDILATGQPWELLALDLREAVRELGEILGEEIGEAVLERIFSQFCLGK